MDDLYNINEIFEIAKQIEKNGSDFYHKAAEVNGDYKNFLIEIAHQEEDHYQIFNNMQKEMSGKQEEDMVDVQDEAHRFLRAIASEIVFKNKERESGAAPVFKSIRDLFETALGKEKDSIIYYMGIREIVPASFGKDKIDNIILEEKRHITWLKERFGKYMK
ncbi:MAG: rubrerythrin [Fibrobacterota bacterium]